MTPTRPGANFWNDGAAPAFHPGMNSRETAIMDYAEALASEATLDAQTASFTLALSQKGKAVHANHASTGIVVTVPPNTSVGFPVGSWVEIDRIGAAAVTVAAGAGVTIRSAGGALGLRAQYSSCTLRKIATDEWLLVGDLV